LLFTGRVAQVFGVQLWNKFLWEQFCFCFLLTDVHFIQISVFAFQTFDYGVSDIFMSAFQMELNDYPHFNLAEDGRLCSTGQHCPGFLRVLYDALVHLGYDGDASIYRCLLSTAHGMDQCEVSVTIPFDPTEPWSGSVIGSELDTGVELMAHMALTSLCEDCLTATAALPIALLPIQNLENPVWQQRLEVVSNLKGPHFHAGMTSLARYAQYLFNLQHNTARTGMQQHTRLTAYKESATAATHEIERLRHENAIIHSGARPPSEQDRELQEVYRRLSNIEHGWNHTCMLLDITCEEVDIRTHRIIHLEHHMEAQDAELEERAEMIANLEQQLLELGAGTT
jgi:cell division protein FtsB